MTTPDEEGAPRRALTSTRSPSGSLVTDGLRYRMVLHPTCKTLKRIPTETVNPDPRFAVERMADGHRHLGDRVIDELECCQAASASRVEW